MLLVLTILYVAPTHGGGCTFTADSQTFDLSGALGAASHEGFSYHAAACAPPPGRAGGACSGSSLAYQVDAQQNCYRLSDEGAQREVSALPHPRVGALVALRGGDACGGEAPRSIKLYVVCGDSQPAEARTAGGCAYTMLLRGPAGCPLECARDAGGAVCGGSARGACVSRGAEGGARCECAEAFSGAACEEGRSERGGAQRPEGGASGGSGAVRAALSAAGAVAAGALLWWVSSKWGGGGAVVSFHCAALAALLLVLLSAAAAWAGASSPADAATLFSAPPPAGLLPAAAAAATPPRCSKSGNPMRTTYVPSALESEWAANIHLWSQDTCARMTAPGAFDKFQALIAVLEAQNTARTSFPGGEEEAAWRAALAAATPLLSRLEHRDAATGALVSTTLLEPLAGMLRDPRKVCYDFLGAAYVAHPFEPPRYLEWDILRPFLFLDPDVKASVAALAPCPGAVALFSNDGPRALLFDVGASTWNDPTGFGIKWLVELSAVAGIRFDHIYSWEAAPRPAYWDGVPLDARSRIHFFNIPAATQQSSEASPVALLRQVARPQDYVVFKLDIDNEAVELPILLDLLSPDVAPLVDDVYVRWLPPRAPLPILPVLCVPAHHFLLPPHNKTV
jgi:hypothetical protein